MPNTYDPNDNDLTSRRKNNTRSTRSSKSNVSSNTDDLVKDLDLTSRKVEKVMKQKVEGEKKVTAEKKKQNEEDKKQSNYQNQQVNMLKNFQKTQSKIVQTQYDQTKILNQINKLMSQSNESEKESLKAQKEALKEQKDKVSLMQDYYDKLNKNYEEQKSYEKQISDMAKTHADMRSKELKNLQSHQIGLWRQQQKNLKDQQNLQESINSGYMKSTDEIKRRFTELKEVQEDIAKQQEETARKIEQTKSLQSKRESLKTDVLNKLGANTDSDIFKYLSSRNKTGVSADQKSFMKASAKLEAASTTIDTVFTSLGTLFTNWLNRFEQGINKIYSVYEETYTKVSVVTDTNQKQYQDWQNETVAVLKQQGLDDNVAISSVMTEMSSIVDKGITDFNKASEMAVQNSINRIISPFVDTTTDAYTNLQLLFGTTFTKDISSMAKGISEQIGSTRVFRKSIDKIIEDLEPVALYAKSEYVTKNAGEMLAGLEQAVKDGYITQSQAIELAYSSTTGAGDWYGMLNSNDLGLQVAAATLNESDIDNPDKILEKTLETYGLGSNSDKRLQSTFLSAIGATGVSQGTDLNGLLSSYEQGKSKYNPNEDYYSSLFEEFSQNDKYTTATAQKDIYAENVSTSVATFKEQYPDAYDMIHSIVGTLGSILSTLIAGFAANGVTNLIGSAGKGISSGLTYAGAGLANGFAKSAPKAIGAGKIGAFTGTGGAIAGAAGVAAGGAMAIKGGMDVYNDFQTGNVNAGTAMSATGAVGGAVGAGALLALGASNPIGWAALAVGGIALAGRAVYDSVKEYQEAGASQLEKMNKQVDEEVKQRESEQAKQLNSLSVLRKQIEKTNDVEEIKEKLISAGISTQEELNDAQYDSKDALLALTDQYIASTKEINSTSNQIYAELQKSQNAATEDYRQKTKEFMDEIVAGVGQTKMYKMDDEGRATTESTVRALFEYYQNAGNLGEDEQKIYDKMKEYMGSAYDNLTWEEIDDIVNTMDNNKTAMRSSINQALQNDDIVQNFTSGYGSDWTANKMLSKLGLEAYVAQDMDAAQSALDQIVSAVNTDKDNEISKDTIKGYIDKFKNATYWYSLDDLTNNNNGAARTAIEKAMEKYGIDSYKVGSNLISSDQLAYLHAGESVLTSSTTANLKEFLGTNDIKNWSSQSLTDNLSNGLGSISSVIVNQTETLVAKMNEIISAIINKNNPVQSVSRTTVSQRDITSLSLS